ncbi:hydrogen peroxide-inducible genes activator [Haliea salexigens]|uniref:hydrogen peroxide-inducible genes activator n=1 Tax=Haliea salexigens TaxID=287487 RepID=UPI000480279E|nr:hydrogen peroxide-inducible genes activator [Haliea salexigens]
MSRQPTLKQLRYLCAVAEYAHFGQAAKACHVSQSTLSAGILELEDTLGVSLVERNNRQVLLTTLGEDVVRRSQDLLRDVEDLVTLCDAAAEPFSGKMRLGVIPTVAPFILPRLLNRLREQYPAFQLFIREDLSQHLVTALHHGELDVLLLALPFPAEGVETMPLFSDEFLLASPPGHVLAGQPVVRTAQLKGEGLLLLEDGHCLREHALEACKLRDSDVSVPYQATSLNTIVQMVANGIGITLLPRMALDAHILSGTNVCISEFSERNVARSIGLMWRRKTPRRAEFRLLGDFVSRCHAGP